MPKGRRPTFLLPVVTTPENMLPGAVYMNIRDPEKYACKISEITGKLINLYENHERRYRLRALSHPVHIHLVRCYTCHKFYTMNRS